jgi:hypothetical protein
MYAKSMLKMLVAGIQIDADTLYGVMCVRMEDVVAGMLIDSLTARQSQAALQRGSEGETARTSWCRGKFQTSIRQVTSVSPWQVTSDILNGSIFISTASPDTDKIIT